ncbi:hypothetical protein KY284_003065 [Solanum tuberosum]|nr:hypothetical protein KY284_003065 [Solanum tuberosum]
MFLPLQAVDVPSSEIVHVWRSVSRNHSVSTLTAGVKLGNFNVRGVHGNKQSKSKDALNCRILVLQ